jgi:hypothetical protein
MKYRPVRRVRRAHVAYELLVARLDEHLNLAPLVVEDELVKLAYQIYADDRRRIVEIPPMKDEEATEHDRQVDRVHVAYLDGDHRPAGLSISET